jgi:hypothetical protein
VQRRALLATFAAVPTAGCGWSQYTNDSPQGRQGAAPDTDDETETDESDPLPTSEGGSEPLEASAEELLLQRSDLDSDEWVETDIQTAATCNAFERSGPEYEFELQSCAMVYDDEATGMEEYDATLDRSRKTLVEESEVTPEIGHEAAIFLEGSRENRIGERKIRLVFRDYNATGQLDFVSDTGMSSGDTVPEVEIADVVAWGASMHGRWRS